MNFFFGGGGGGDTKFVFPEIKYSTLLMKGNIFTYEVSKPLGNL